jgi:N utilization substance protein B
MTETQPKNPSAEGSRRRGREAALQMLYLADLTEQPTEDYPAATWSEEPLTPKVKAFAEHIVNGVAERRAELDTVIMKYAENWEMKRMATIDRCLLRLSAFELLVDVETPVNVIINEAVEIAKKFSTAESGKFVNGILDKVKLERPPQGAD